MEENNELRRDDGEVLQSSLDAKMKKMRAKKAKQMFASTVALIITTVIIFAAQTVAFFSDDVTSGANQIRSGNLGVKVVEATIPAGATDPIPYPAEPIRIMPSVTQSKIVTVESTGSLNAWVRVKVEKTVTSTVNGQQLAVDTSLFSCDFNTKDWTQNGEYWYYNTPLKAGETTAPLFQNVTFASEMDNTYASSTITFFVIANAVQSEGNGSSALDAAWGIAGHP